MRIILTAVFALWAASAAAQTGAPVSFSGDGGLTLTGVLYRPSGAGPFPAVVALHGCGGLCGVGGGVSARHADWGGRLSAQGFAVLLPDSFGPRGLGSQCAASVRSARASRERVADARAALAYLQSLPDIKPGAVSLLGWSNGGSTVLYGVRPGAEPASGRDFATAVAFYPGCRTPLESGAWRTRLPLLILVGEADDWTGAGPCRALAAQARGRGEPVEFTAYPGAFHDFDHPSAPPRVRKGLGFTLHNTGEAHTGTDPAARADALVRVPAFLAR